MDPDDESWSAMEQTTSRGAQELWSKLVVASQKQYFFDLRENARGVYLKVTEVGPMRKRSTVLLPAQVVKSLRDLLQGAVEGRFEAAAAAVPAEALEGRGVALANSFVEIGQKKFYADLMQNQRGRILKVAEAQANRGRAVIVLPESGWLQAKRALEELAAKVPSFLDSPSRKSAPAPSEENQADGPAQAKPPAPPAPQSAAPDAAEGVEPAEQGQAEANPAAPVAEDSPSAAAPETAPAGEAPAAEAPPGNSKAAAPPKTAAAPVAATAPAAAAAAKSDQGPKPAVECPVTATDARNKKTLLTRTMKATNKRFYCDLQENDFGRYLKVAQLGAGFRETVVLPFELLEPLAALFQALEDKDAERDIEHLDKRKPAASSQSAKPGVHFTKNLGARSYHAANRKSYFLDHCENNMGEFLRISEVNKHHRNAVQIPESCYASFKETLQECVAFPES